MKTPTNMEANETPKRKAGRPMTYNSKTQMLSVTIPVGLLAALDANVDGPKGRSKAVVVMLAQALNYNLEA